jgi:hypothetical protein
MIALAPFHPHTLKPLEPHPGLPASLEESLLGRKKFGKILKRKTFEGPTFRGIEKTFADIIPVAGKELFHAVAGYEIDPHTAQRGGFFFYEQH